MKLRKKVFKKIDLQRLSTAMGYALLTILFIMVCLAVLIGALHFGQKFGGQWGSGAVMILLLFTIITAGAYNDLKN